MISFYSRAGFLVVLVKFYLFFVIILLNTIHKGEFGFNLTESFTFSFNSKFTQEEKTFSILKKRKFYIVLYKYNSIILDLSRL